MQSKWSFTPWYEPSGALTCVLEFDERAGVAATSFPGSFIFGIFRERKEPGNEVGVAAFTRAIGSF